jgi:hypothetical protein
MERWRTVFDANGSSPANVTFVAFGIARTSPKAVRMIVAHPFLGASSNTKMSAVPIA